MQNRYNSAVQCDPIPEQRQLDALLPEVLDKAFKGEM